MTRRRRLPVHTSKHPRQPVRLVVAAPEAHAKAVELAGGDLRRLVVQPNGSILVVNRPRARA